MSRGKLSAILVLLALPLASPAAGQVNMTVTAYEVAGGSCPYVAPWDGTQFVPDNDIYSVARGELASYRDHYSLSRPLVADGVQYKLQILEVDRETSYTDFVQLVAVDHAPGVQVGTDSAGRMVTYVEPFPPQGAVDATGDDVTAELSAQDGVAAEAFDGESFVLDFSDLEPEGRAVLVLRVKGFETAEHGEGPPTYKRPSIEVQTQDATGQWVTRYSFKPRMEWATEAYDLGAFLGPRAGFPSLVRLQVVSCNVGKYHLIDFAGLDTSPAEPTGVTELAPVSAVHSVQGDVLGALRSADGQPVVTRTDEKIQLAFDVPSLAPGLLRDFVFVSEGYYVPTPHGTFYFYTWNGGWVQRFTDSFVGSEQTKSYNMSSYLPDSQGEYKVRIFQNYNWGQSWVNYVGMSRNGSALPISTATNSQNGASVVGELAGSDGSRVYWNSGRNRYVNVSFIGVVNRAPSVANDSWSVNEDSTLTVAATGVLANDSDPDGSGITAVKVTNPANGSLSFNANGSFTYTPSGNWCGSDSFTYYASDGSLNSVNATVTITVNCVNDTPSVNAGGNKSGTEGSSISFSGSYSDPDAGQTYTIAWNFGDNTTSSGSLNTTHVYADNGSYTVTLTITDSSGGVGTSTATVTVTNGVPVVSPGANQTINEGGTVSLAPATFTDVGNADSWTASVAWGDGTTSVGAINASKQVTASHVYFDNGSYTVTVTLTDDDAGVGSGTFTVTVNNVAPTVTAGANATINEGGTFSLAPATFTDPSTADTFTASISWGDTTSGAGTVNASRQVNASHVYTDNGSYTVTVTVTDDNGGVGSNTLTVTVNNVAPTVTAGNNTAINEGGTFTLASTFTDPAGTSDTHTASISWGDAASGAGTVDQANDKVSGSHVYAENGSYTVTVTVTDDNGGVGSRTLIVTVNNVAPTVEAGNNRTINEGSVFTLAPATFTDPGGTRDTYTFTVTWGDGSAGGNVALGQNAINGTHSYTDNGSYTVTVTVTDDDGGVGSDTLTVTVNNAAPVVSAGADQSLDEGGTQTLAPAWFSDGPGSTDTHTATIDWGDGTPVVAGTVNEDTDRVSGSHLYTDNGTYTVKVTVIDDDGGSGFDTFLVTVRNVAPSAVEAGPNQTVVEGQLVSLAPATFSDVGAGDTHTATINWGDGTPVVAGSVDQANDRVSGSHTYADNGEYIVTVTVTDDDGGSRFDGVVIWVNNAVPVVDAGLDKTGNEGASITLNPATFTDAGSSDTHTATINWGDGTGLQAGTVNQGADTVTGSHVYADNGVYTVTVRVTDNNNAAASDVFLVTILNVAPVPQAGPDQTVTEGATVNLAPATFADAGSADTYTATINWGDGTAAVAGTVVQALRTVASSHVYADNGAFTVTVTVTDDNGGSASDTLLVTVNNVAPTINAGVDQNVAEGVTVNLAPASYDDVGTGDTHTAKINWGDGTPQANGTVNGVTRKISGSHVYADSGAYVVIVTVTDDEGAAASDILTVSVSNVAPVVEAGPNRTVFAVLDTVTLAPATYSDAGSGDTHSAKVDWGDGTPPTDGVMDQAADTVGGSHVYTVTGTYTAKVTVTDDDGSAGFDTFTVVVNNVVPTIEVLSPNGGEVVHGVSTIRYKIRQIQGKPLTLEAFLGAQAVPLIEGSAVQPPGNGSVGELTKTFDSTAFADGRPYSLRLVAKITADPSTQVQDSSQSTFTIDNTPPIVTMLADEVAPTLEQATLTGTPYAFHVEVADALDPSPQLVVTGSRASYPLGVTTVTFTATDSGTNVRTATSTVTVLDRTPPVLTVDPPIVAEAMAPEGTPIRLTPSVSDLCDAQVSLVNDAPALFPVGRTVVTFTATDASGNVTVRTVEVTITDATPPVVTLPFPPQSTWEQTAPAGTAGAQVTLPVPETSDLGYGDGGLTCTATMTLVDETGAPQEVTVACGDPLPEDLYFPAGETVVTYQVVDDSGNVREETYTVRIDDSIPPQASVDDGSPGAGSEDWTTDPVTITLEASDGGDAELDVVISPAPSGTDGNMVVGEDGQIELVYDQDGIYDVTVTIRDDEGNETVIVLERFYVDLDPPQAEIQGLPDDPAELPLLFAGELFEPVFTASDATSGLASIEALLLPGGEEEQDVVTVLEVSYPAEGTPPFGPATSGELVCDDQEGFCQGGVFDSAGLTLGVQQLVLRATDVLDHEQEIMAPLEIIPLASGLAIVRGRVAGYLAGPLAAPARASLQQVDARLATAEISLSFGYLGGALLRMESAAKAMTSEALVAAVPSLADDARLLARGAFAATRMYWLDVAQETEDGAVAAGYLDTSADLTIEDLLSPAVLAAESAYFYARNAEAPFLVTDGASSVRVFLLLLEELTEYADNHELPGWEVVGEVHYQLFENVLWKYEDLRDSRYVSPANIIDLLLDLQDMANLLFDAQEQGVWVRNWQWGLAQLAREAVNFGKAGVEQDVAEGDDGYCKIEQANVEYRRGMAWLDNRDVDLMLDLYASQDIRCLMLELYQIGGYRPAVDLTAHGCAATGCIGDGE